MRIDRLELLRFGPFTDTVLDFGSPPDRLEEGAADLHIVYGPNEAGKSTALRALRQFLYGIPARSTDDFLHRKADMRIGGVVRTADGRQVACVRRKGNVRTLLAADGMTHLDDDPLEALLVGLSQAHFEQMFGIDHETLVAGGKEILAGKGDIGEMIFTAGAGISNLRALAQALEAECAELFKSSGTRPRINALLAELKTARQAVTQAQLPSARWEEHDAAHRAATERKHEIDVLLRDLTARRQKLERLRDALPKLATRADLLQKLAPLATVPILPDDFTDRRVSAQNRHDTAQIQQRNLQAELAEVDQAMAKIEVPQALIDQADAIEQRQEALGAYRKALRDLPKLEGAYRERQRGAAVALRAVRPDLSLEDAEQLRLTTAEQQRIGRLAAEQGKLVQRVDDAQKRVADLEREQAKIRDDLAELPAPRDSGELRRAVTRAQKLGPLEGRLADLTAALRKSHEQADVELKRLGRWAGPLPELEALPIPDTTVIEDFDDRQRTAERDLKSLARQRADKQDEATAAASEVEKLRLEHDVPTEDDLAEARAHRDAGFALIERAWHGESELNLDADIRAYLEAVAPPTGDLADAYRAAVARADDLADHLRREADRVATLAQLKSQVQQHQQRLATMDRQIASQEQAIANLQAQWRDLWQPVGISPGTPKEMRAWWKQYESLMTRAETSRGLAADIESLKQQIVTECDALGACLEALGEPASASETLEQRLSRCSEILEGIESTESRRRSLSDALPKLDNDLPLAQIEAERAAESLAVWQDQWNEAMARLGLAPETSPAEASAIVEEYRTITTALDESRTVADRIEELRREDVRFAADVQALVQVVAPDLADHPADVAAADLSKRLKEARHAEAALGKLAVKRDSLQQQLRATGETIEAAQAELLACCHEAGCDDPEQLPEAQHRSAKRKDLERELRQTEVLLRECSGGLTIDALLREVEAIDRDQLEPDIAKLRDEIDALQKEGESVLQTIGSEATLLAQMDGRADAALAAEQAQELVAALRTQVADYARTCLASAVLRKAIERYREKHQDPILARAGTLFSELTGGAFAELRPDFDDKGNANLIGVRAAPDAALGTASASGPSTVTVDGMSTGTADQLYLALRLASIERHLEHHPPMPFIVDDILIQFDNDRSAATLRVLARLARQTQVIFFTHHEHLLGLAEQSLPHNAWHVNHLSAATVPHAVQ